VNSSRTSSSILECADCLNEQYFFETADGARNYHRKRRVRPPTVTVLIKRICRPRSSQSSNNVWRNI
jgi:hypothetical protein